MKFKICICILICICLFGCITSLKAKDVLSVEKPYLTAVITIKDTDNLQIQDVITLVYDEITDIIHYVRYDEDNKRINGIVLADHANITLGYGTLTYIKKKGWIYLSKDKGIEYIYHTDSLDMKNMFY